MPTYEVSGWYTTRTRITAWVEARSKTEAARIVRNERVELYVWMEAEEHDHVGPTHVTSVVEMPEGDE